MDHNTHTHVWQEERGKPVFRFQTQDKDVHLYLSRKEGFKLVGWGFNIDLWIYRAKYQSLRIKSSNFYFLFGIEKELDTDFFVFSFGFGKTKSKTKITSSDKKMIAHFTQHPTLTKADLIAQLPRHQQARWRTLLKLRAETS